MRCHYCGEGVEKVTGEAIYPERPDLWGKQFFLCRPCEAWVGTHENSGHPLGRLANAELRIAKKQAHQYFDPLWKHLGMRRKDAYKWLAEELEIPPKQCHIGWFDEAQCSLVVAAARRKQREIRAQKF